MRTLDNEKLVNYLVVHDKPGRKFSTEEDIARKKTRTI